MPSYAIVWLYPVGFILPLKQHICRNNLVESCKYVANQINSTSSISGHSFVELVCEINECVPSKVPEPLTGVEIKLPSQIVLALAQVLPATLVTLAQELSNAQSRN